jgi:hypothetical protein
MGSIPTIIKTISSSVIPHWEALIYDRQRADMTITSRIDLNNIATRRTDLRRRKKSHHSVPVEVHGIQFQQVIRGEQ